MYKKILLVLVPLVLGVFVVRSLPAKSVVLERKGEMAPQSFFAEQEIVFGDQKESIVKKVEVYPGNSVLDVLSKTQKVEIKEYSFGKMVEAIEDIYGGENNKYWLYSVNDKEAQVGAADYKLSPGDSIKWELK